MSLFDTEEEIQAQKKERKKARSSKWVPLVWWGVIFFIGKAVLNRADADGALQLAGLGIVASLIALWVRKSILEESD